MMVLDYKLSLVVIIGLSMGICVSLYAWYCVNYIRETANRIRRLIQALLYFCLVLIAIVVSGYVFNTDLFEELDSHSGRTLFMLLWIIPLSVTSVYGWIRFSLRISRQRKSQVLNTTIWTEKNLGVAKAIKQVAVETGTPALIVLLALSLLMTIAGLYVGIFREGKFLAYLGIAVFGICTLFSALLLMTSIKSRSR